MSRTENNILLFSITLCWAASYVFIKDLPSGLSTYAYLTMTCGIAAVLLTVVFFKKLKGMKPAVIGKASILSVFLLLNLLFDKLGIDRLASSTASVLASTSILIVPVVMIMMRKCPQRTICWGPLSSWRELSLPAVFRRKTCSVPARCSCCFLRWSCPAIPLRRIR